MTVFESKAASALRLVTAWALVGVLGMSQAASAAEAGTPGPDAQTSATLSRAQVQEDLRLWQQAGVDRYEERARYYQLDVAEYEQALARYHRLKARTELARLGAPHP